LARGDRIRFLARAKLTNAEVINGDEATVADIRRTANNRIEIAAQTQQTKLSFCLDQIADEAGRAKIAHAYATTIHGAQGLTVGKAYCWLTAEMDRHDVYVASSRAREETRFFVDAKAIDARVTAELPLAERSKSKELAAEDRRDYLARQLARSGLKQTTLDVLVAAAAREEDRLRREQAHPRKRERATKSDLRELSRE
jgi:ATP-dependent exoDNAse (exonuclease V) alpha subunit